MSNYTVDYTESGADPSNGSQGTAQAGSGSGGGMDYRHGILILFLTSMLLYMAAAYGWFRKINNAL